jgi:hypothetical protein
VLEENELIKLRRDFVRHERLKRDYCGTRFYEIRHDTAASLFRRWDDAATARYEARARRLLEAYRISYNMGRTGTSRYSIAGSLPTSTMLIDGEPRRSPYLTELFLHEYAHVAHMDPSKPVEEIPLTLEDWVMSNLAETTDENEIAASSSTFLALTMLKLPFSPMAILESVLKNLSHQGRTGSGTDMFVNQLAERVLTFTPTVRLVAERCVARMQRGKPLLETA